MCCFDKKLEVKLTYFLKQEPENALNKIIISSNPQNFLNNYNTNKKKLLKQRIYTIDQLAQNQNVLHMIMSEVEAEQFILAYNYRTQQRSEPISQLAVGNSGYLYKLSYQGILNDGRNVLVIGEKGSGKSTLINALANSLIIDYADRYRYQISYYDYNGYIQECNLDENNIKFKFLEVIGYGQDLQQNQKIMLSTYEYLQQNNIQIDCIIICRRFGHQAINKNEKQIIFHLAEIFGQQYIQKCFLVNTNYDLGTETQIQDLLRVGLNNIQQIYDIMPNPKILFVNSQIVPFEGKEGVRRFETVKIARDAITNLIGNNNQGITFINPEAFKHRRQKENSMKQIKNSIKSNLVELLPCLENYFQICQIDENNDELFYANTVFWSTLERDERKRNSKELSLILDEIILPDSILKKIEKESNQFLTSITLDIERQMRKTKELKLKEQLIYLRNKLTVEKTNRLQTIIQLADEYIQEQQHFLQETYLHIEETREQLITLNMNNQLRLYLQQDQNLDNQELQRQFEAIRLSLYLPNTNLFATQIIAN